MIDTKSKGFTLLELLICITILAMILSILTGVFRLGFQAWKYSDKNLPERDFIRSFTHVVVSQIRSAYPSRKPAFHFHGKANEMSFVTTLSMFGDTTDLCYVSYRIIEDKRDPGRYQLMVYEKLFKSDSILPEAIPLEEFVPFLKGIKEFHFAYLSPPVAGQQAKWEAEWNERDPSPLPPDAVKIHILFEGALPPVDLIIPVYCSGLISRMLGKV